MTGQAQGALKADVRDCDSHLNGYAMHELLDRACEKFPDNVAVNFEGQTLTYSELKDHVDDLVVILQGYGITKGTKVGLFMPNHTGMVACHYAILKTGATVVNYNPLYAAEELIYQINDSDTEFMMTLGVEPLIEKLLGLTDQVSLQKIFTYGVCDAISNELVTDVLAAATENTKPIETLPTINPDTDIAILQYTGGTTGVPKGAMLSHTNLSMNVEQFYQWLSPVLTEGVERQLGVLPLFHVFALTVVMNYSFRMGMEIQLLSKFDPKQIAPLLEETPPTFLAAVPAIYNALATHPATSSIDLSNTKFAVAGGAPIPAEVKRLFEERLNTKVAEAYGLTEASPVVASNPPAGVIQLGSIGPAISLTEVDIISIEDGETVLAPHEKGELCVRGPQVMMGYYKKPEATEKVIKNGRLHTGDIAYKDDDGYIYIVDRLKDMVLVNGYNVYPTQIENKIYEHELVEECIVAGVLDDKRGEVVWAWVKQTDTDETLSDSDLRAFLKTKLSTIEMPRKFFVGREPLPKTAVGKLSKKLLLEQQGLKR